MRLGAPVTVLFCLTAIAWTLIVPSGDGNATKPSSEGTRALTDIPVARPSPHFPAIPKVTEEKKTETKVTPDSNDAVTLIASLLDGKGGEWDDASRKLEDQIAQTQSDDEKRTLVELLAFSELMRDRSPAVAKKLGDDFSRRFPKWGIGPYHAAWAEYQNGERERAIELVREALAREPHESRYHKTLQSLIRGETGEIFLQDLKLPI